MRIFSGRPFFCAANLLCGHGSERRQQLTADFPTRHPGDIARRRFF
jgi:hypothetical protein